MLFLQFISHKGTKAAKNLLCALSGVVGNFLLQTVN